MKPILANQQQQQQQQQQQTSTTPSSTATATILNLNAPQQQHMHQTVVNGVSATSQPSTVTGIMTTNASNMQQQQQQQYRAVSAGQMSCGVVTQTQQATQQQQPLQQAQAAAAANQSPNNRLDLLRCLRKFLHTLLELANGSLPEKYPLVQSLIQDLLVCLLLHSLFIFLNDQQINSLIDVTYNIRSKCNLAFK
jgi:hypothetical protein